MKYSVKLVSFIITSLALLSCGGGGGDNTQQPQNNPPLANAGPDISADENSVVILDASGSTDPDADSLSYIWTQTAGTSVSLSSSTIQSPEFLAPELLANETLTFSLVVNDGQVSSSIDSVQVNISANNDAPTANAGNDFAIEEGQSSSLNGSGSDDPENQPLNYTWEQLTGPDITLSDVNSVQPQFTVGNYVSDQIVEFQLTVADGDNINNDTVVFTITASNDAPIADAGSDFNSLVDEFVSLDCTASGDPENETISYSWQQISGAPVTLSDSTSCNPGFLLPKIPETFVFGLTVNDGVNDSAEDQVIVDTRYYSGETASLYGNPALIEKSLVINQSFTTAQLYSNGEYIFMRRVDEDFLTRGMDIISVQDPLNPIVIGTINDEVPTSIEVVGDLVYYTHGLGMSIASIADPTSPQVLDSFSFNGDGETTIAVNGNAVYCTDADGNFIILNATDPSNILGFESFPINNSIANNLGRGMLYQNGYAYVVNGTITSGLRLSVVNINILNPAVVGSINLFAALSQRTPIVADGDWLFVGANGQIVNIDVSTPETPNANNVRYRQVVEVKNLEMDVDNDRLYIANDSSGVVVLDVSDPSNMQPTAIFAMNSYIDGAVKLGSYIYASESFKRNEGKLLHILPDIDNTSSLAVTSRFNLPSSFEKMAVSDQHVFAIGNSPPEVKSVDFSIVDIPTLRDSANLLGAVVDITRTGDSLAITMSGGGSSTLSLLDITDPNSIQAGDNVSIFDGTERWGQVALNNSTAFVSKTSDPRGGFIGVEAFNISDIDNVSSIANYTTSATHPYYPPIQIKDDIVYGADQILEVSDPTNPMPLSQFRLGQETLSRVNTESRIVDNRLFVTTYFGVDVFDIETPTAPQLITQSDYIITPQDLTIVGDQIIVEERGNGIQILDFSDGQNLNFSGQFNVYSHPAAAVDNGLNDYLKALDTLDQYVLAMDSNNIITVNPANPLLHTNVATSVVNSILSYQVTWGSSTYSVNHVGCVVSGGDCVVMPDFGLQTAEVIWNLPLDELGEFEIIFTVGDETYYFASADQVVVE